MTVNNQLSTSYMNETLSRRRVLQTTLAAGGAIALAGCTGTDDDEPADEELTGDVDPTSRVVENPPAAVYVPTHAEVMRHLDPVSAGEFELVPMATYPHRFWNVTGDRAVEAEPSGEDDAHLMITVRDPETGIVLPARNGLEIVVDPDGAAESHSPWPMISQGMGFHIGDNIPLGDNGTYEIEVSVGALDIERFGAFAGRFEESASARFSLEIDDDFRRLLTEVEYFDEEHWGELGAIEPMMHHGHGDHGGHDDHHDDHSGHDDHGHHDDDHEHGDHHDDHGQRRFGTHERDSDVTELPPAGDLPGTLQGTPTSGDAVIATTLLSAESRFVDGDSGYYLAVSPRTPYNRGMLPTMTIDATVEREGHTEPVVDEQLSDALDHELGYHYGVHTTDLESGDTLTVSFPSPPSVSRHQGYETAFLDMEPVELTIELP